MEAHAALALAGAARQGGVSSSCLLRAHGVSARGKGAGTACRPGRQVTTGSLLRVPACAGECARPGEKSTSRCRGVSPSDGPSLIGDSGRRPRLEPQRGGPVGSFPGSPASPRTGRAPLPRGAHGPSSAGDGLQFGKPRGSPLFGVWGRPVWAGAHHLGAGKVAVSAHMGAVTATTGEAGGGGAAARPPLPSEASPDGEPAPSTLTGVLGTESASHASGLPGRRSCGCRVVRGPLWPREGPGSDTGSDEVVFLEHGAPRPRGAQ